MKYRERILESVASLFEAQREIFSSIINLSAEGEMKDYLDGFEEGTVINFDIEMFTDTNDQTVQILIDQYMDIHTAMESIININALSKDELKNYLEDSEPFISEIEKKQKLEQIYNDKKKAIITLMDHILDYASFLDSIDEKVIDAMKEDGLSLSGLTNYSSDLNLKFLLETFKDDCNFLQNFRKTYKIIDDNLSINWNYGDDQDDLPF